MMSTENNIDRLEIAKSVSQAVSRFQARLLRVDDLSVYLSCSKLYAKKLAEAAGAVRRLGASWYADRTIIDDYISTHPGDLVPPETVATWRGGKNSQT